MTLDEKIKTLDKQIAEINRLMVELKTEAKHEPLAGYIDKIDGDELTYYIDNFGEVGRARNCVDYSLFNPFHNYPTAELANEAANIKKLNDIMEAFKSEYETGEVDWSDESRNKYMVYYKSNCEWRVDTTVTFMYATVYFANKSAAERCADWLNSYDPKGSLIAP